MGMSLRQRILAVYSGDVPDVVPYMLDLSHWFYHRNHLPWDLSVAYEAPERELIDCHRRLGCGFYLANLASFYSASFSEDVVAETEKQVREDGRTEIVWGMKTPLGEIERRRVWEESTYGWGISRWGVRNERDLAVLAYAMSRRRFDPQWRNYRAWVDEVGELGVVYVVAGYSAMGYLLHYWMGVEGVAYATADFPDALRRAVDEINANNLRLVDLLAQSPAEVVILGDNFSSDVQSPAFFAKWSKPYYDEAVRRLHAAGKRVAVHIDGRLRGAIGMIRRTGADCGDAITPTPMGDLTPEACRDEAGPDFILSGGVSPNLWLPGVPVDRFKAKVLEWLKLRKRSPRLIAGAGDQVPPGADEDRIHIMRDLVEEHGKC